uniref:Integrase catalytic domain-containing protein n=1 Tax=Amphimedon queenslandica TaxID=400682 RepID=A0A1X7UTI8_AMPQE
MELLMSPMSKVKDRFMPEAFPIPGISALTIARAFAACWISRFGATSTGTVKCCTTAYHRQANGVIERFHRQLKAALKVQPLAESCTESSPYHYWVLILLLKRTYITLQLN